MNTRKAFKQQVSRRGFLLSGATLGLGASLSLNSVFAGAESAVAATTVNSAVIKASAVYVNFQTRVASSYGVSKTIGTLVSGDGLMSPGGTNMMGPFLPFHAGDPATNTVPIGLEWHGSSVPKTLVSYTGDSIRYTGKTTASTQYLGGVRTQTGVVAPGQSVLLSFNADFVSLTGDPNASILVQLLRSDGTTLYQRAYNAQEEAGMRCIVRLVAPPGGTEKYRIVFMALAGSAAANQSATIDISNISVIAEPAVPRIGIRYAAPKYSRTTVPVKNLLVKPAVAAGEYYLLVRTDEFGWASESVMVSSTATQIDVKTVLGATADVTVRELLFIARSRWTSGWMSSLSPTAWTPLLFMNINNTAGQSRVESPNRIGRATGLVTTSSGPAPEDDNAYPLATLDAPPIESAAFDSNRLSYLSFTTDKGVYIGELPSEPVPSRSEIGFRKSVGFGQHVWTAFSVRAMTTLSDSSAARKALLMQFRYVRNKTGDSSQLGPDLAFEQLTNNRFVLHYRTDNGVPVLAGKSTPAGITTVELGPWPYVPGEWHRVVLHTVFSDTGGGYLGFWLDGTQIIDKPVAMGYRRNIAPKLRIGSYKFSDFPSQVEFQNIETGTRDLTSRITRPLPV